MSYGFIEGISKGLNKLTFLVLPFILADIDSFGFIGLLVSIELILPYFTLLGLERAILRFYSEKQQISAFEQTIFKMVNLAHIAAILCILLLNQFYDTIFGIDIFPFIYLVVVLVYLQGINLLHLNIYRASNQHKIYFGNRLVLQILKFALVLLFVYFLNGPMGYLVGAILAALITNIVYRKKKLSLTGEGYMKFPKETMRTLLLFSWPFIFHSLASNLLGNADKFILERYLDMEQVGLYTFAYSFGTSVVFAFLGITVYIEPLIYKENEEEKRKILLNKFLLMALAMGILATLAIYLISIFVLPELYKTSYQSVIYLIPLIAISYILQPFYFKANYQLIYAKKSFNIAFVSIVSCILNIILNIVLIPKFGIIAAVYTTFISNALQYMMFVLMANKFKIDSDFIELTILSIGISFFIYYEISILYIFLYLIMYLCYFYYFKMRKTIKIKSSEI